MHRTIVLASLAVGFAVVATEPVYSAPKKNAPLTLSGCLRADGARYLLTDMAGVNAPASRSWKTGFIKKSSKHIEIVGTTPAMKMKDHLGRQVSVTGTSAGGWKIRARTVKSLGACS